MYNVRTCNLSPYHTHMSHPPPNTHTQGLFAENKEKLINGALTALLLREDGRGSVSISELEGQFHALRRLVASKAGFEAFTTLPK